MVTKADADRMVPLTTVNHRHMHILVCWGQTSVGKTVALFPAAFQMSRTCLCNSGGGIIIAKEAF